MAIDPKQSEELIREYGTACRVAGKDAWLLHLAERGEAKGLERYVEEARARGAEERATAVFTALLAEREEMQRSLDLQREMGDAARRDLRLQFDRAEAAERDLTAALAVLREVEWKGDRDGFGESCPWCRARTVEAGHAPDCRLAALLGSRR